MWDTGRRWAALATGSAALAAAGLVTATAGMPISGYVSEAGVSGAPHPVIYRLGIFAIAAALGLLALGLRSALPLAGAALALATPLAGVSGAVTCSPGCPLPPYEDPTAADLVHAAGSVASLALTGLAILIITVRAPDGPVRRVARLGTFIAIPLLTAAGLAMLLAGRGVLTGVLERTAVAAALAWVTATAAVHALVGQPPPTGTEDAPLTGGSDVGKTTGSTEVGTAAGTEGPADRRRDGTLSRRLPGRDARPRPRHRHRPSTVGPATRSAGP